MIPQDEKITALIKLAILPILLLFLYVLNIKYIGLDNDDYGILVVFFAVILFFLATFPSLSKEFKNNLIRTKNLKYIIFYPILIGFFLNFLLTLSMYIPLLFDKNPIKPGTTQFSYNLGLLSISSFILRSFLPAFNEEIIFHHGSYHLLKWFTSYNEKIYKKKSVLFIWAILTSYFFARKHGVDLSNFYMYFLSGLISAFLYIKYGFVACMTKHISFNYFSPLAYKLALIIINDII